MGELLGKGLELGTGDALLRLGVDLVALADAGLDQGQRARGHHTAVDAAYDAQAKKLAEMFRKNFEKFGSVAVKIRDAGPQG